MERYTIKDLLRAESVTRWHTVPTVRDQSLAEHQWNVCMISVSLALRMGLDDETISEIRDHALVHDIDEIRTGDMPSPHKEALKKREPLPESSSGYAGRWPSGSDESHRGTVEHPWNVVDPVIRAADRIDAAIWSSKYVMDDDVVADCAVRLSRFQKDNRIVSLNTAISQVMTELLH